MIIKYLNWIWILILVFLPISLILLGLFNFLVNFQYIEVGQFQKDEIKKMEDIIGLFSMISLSVFTVFFTILYFKLIVGVLNLIGKSSTVVLIISITFTLFLIPRFGSLLIVGPIEYGLNQINFISSLEIPKLFEIGSLNTDGISAQNNSVINYDTGYEDGFKDGMNLLANSNSEQSMSKKIYFGHNILINNLTTYVLRSTYSFIRNFVTDFLIIFFGLFLIYGFSKILTNYVFKDIEGFKQSIQTHKVSIIYFFILLVGAILSLSSIIAYPRFLEDQSSALVTKEEFIKRLDEIEKNRAFDFSAFEIKEPIKLDTIKSWAIKPDTVGNIIYFDYNRILSFNRNILSNYPLSIENLKNEYNNNVRNAKLELLLKFDLEYSVSSFVDRQRGKALANFYQKFNSYFDNLHYSISTFPKYETVKSLINDFNSTISDINSRKPLDQINIQYLPYSFGVNLPDFYYYNEYFVDQRRDIFKLLSNWIVESESQEMVLITGMLGFGLLGAGISAIYRKRKYNDENFESTNYSILLGSISSSVVIYLAVKGGISVFSKGGDIEINYYSILLLCLIGSVYSEIIWERASNYLKSSSGGKDDFDESSKKDESKSENE
jgi:hypothetical protein